MGSSDWLREISGRYGGARHWVLAAAFLTPGCVVYTSDLLDDDAVSLGGAARPNSQSTAPAAPTAAPLGTSSAWTANPAALRPPQQVNALRELVARAPEEQPPRAVTNNPVPVEDRNDADLPAAEAGYADAGYADAGSGDAAPFSR